MTPSSLASSTHKPLRRRSAEGHVWRADLLRALRHDLNPADLDTVAHICGFERRPETPARSKTSTLVERAIKGPKPKPIGGQPDRTSGLLRFYQPTEYKHIDTEPVRALPREIAGRPIEIGALRAGPYRMKPEPLQSWSRLWPHLHHILGVLVPGRRIDLPRLVGDMAALRPVRSLPRRHHPAWAPRVHIHIDGTMAMDPFQPDIDVLLTRLRRMRGREGLHCRVLPFGPDSLKDAVNIETWETGSPPHIAPGEPVLAFSDMGCLDGDGHRREAWLRYGLHLRQTRRAALFALLPCPRDRWTLALASIWRCSAWDRNERPLPGGRGQSPSSPSSGSTEYQEMLNALLRICSVMVRIESPLVRELRLLLPDADIGLEHDLWHHLEVAATPRACALRFEQAAKRLDELIQADDQHTVRLKKALAVLLARHHQTHSAPLRARELLNARSGGLPITDEALAEAVTVMRRCNRARLEEILSTGKNAIRQDLYGLGAFNRRDLNRMGDPELARVGESELAAACAIEDYARGGRGTYTESVGEDAYLRTIRYLLGESDIEQRWPVNLCGPLLQFSAPVPDSSVQEKGMPQALTMKTPQVNIDIERDTSIERISQILKGQSSLRLRIENADSIRLATDCSELIIDSKEAPPWATRFGWDSCGLFAQFKVEGIAFDLRWIPPGEFMMGSPEDEQGRYDHEGPQHRVTVGTGFWLGSTPVTQGQYAAVAGQHPSEFKHAGDRAPVERVSWENCREFCRTLKKKVDDLDDNLAFRLPTEAQWEYACRAGTTTALYTGALTIKGENNGPELDTIA